MNYEMQHEEIISHLHTIQEQYPDNSTAYQALDMAISNLSEKLTGSNNGWIPCSSGKFPTDEVLVCREDGVIDFDVYDLMYEDWKFNSNHHKNKVIAWMPLPAPYKENENGKI